MRVVVYKNLNRGDWSVAELKGRLGYSKVIDHVAEITLENVVFHVQPAAQAKVFAGAARTVHAWAIGDVSVSYRGEPLAEIHYNPRRCGYFHTLPSGARINSASYVHFSADGRCYRRNS